MGKPPEEWVKRFSDAFHVSADLDCGVDPAAGWQYALEFWSYLTDEQRAERVANPEMGDKDGEDDAEMLNAA